MKRKLKYPLKLSHTLLPAGMEVEEVNVDHPELLAIFPDIKPVVDSTHTAIIYADEMHPIIISKKQLE